MLGENVFGISTPVKTSGSICKCSDIFPGAIAPSNCQTFLTIVRQMLAKGNYHGEVPSHTEHNGW